VSVGRSNAQPAARPMEFRRGEATALPFPENSFDATVMALVIFFLPDPARGVAEMVRAVRPGGMVAIYAWEMLGGGFPFEPILVELRALELAYPQPPSADASRIDALKVLWEAAGLEAIEPQGMRVQRTFADFEEFWTTTVGGGTNVGQTLAGLPADTIALLRQRVQARLPADAAGRITYGAHANAVKGRVPE